VPLLLSTRTTGKPIGKTTGNLCKTGGNPGKPPTVIRNQDSLNKF